MEAGKNENMTTLPPISASREREGETRRGTATITASSPNNAHSNGSTRVSSPRSGVYQTVASTADGINRNRLRQEAERRVQHITCGVAERQTYLEVLRHIEERFAHTSHEPLRPLVQPPQLPSTARPREPQSTRFSRGLTRHPDKAALGENSVAGVAARTAEMAGATAGSAAQWTERGAAGESADTQSTSTGFTEAHHWEMLSGADRTFFHSMRDERSTDTPTVAPSSALHTFTGSPLDLLPTLEEKVQYLLELEVAERQYLTAYENWDLQVIAEMMAVHFVTFVLKPSMDILRREEAEEREALLLQEDQLSFFMYHESSLALQVQEGLKTMTARKLQLNRILHVSGDAWAPNSVGSGCGTLTPHTPVPPERNETKSPIPKAPVSSPETQRATSVTSMPPLTDSGVQSHEARRLLQQYVRHRHGASLDAVGAGATVPHTINVSGESVSATYPGTGVAKLPARRSSTLVLPPISGANAPSRNAVGIADYVALLDDYQKHREQIIKAEHRSRTDMNRACYEEQQVVLEWQRRRMHLERLVYWRNQRETVVKEEVNTLTTVTPALRLDAKVLLLLELFEGDEDAARQELLSEEHEDFTALWAFYENLTNAVGQLALECHCMNVLHTEVWTPECMARQQLVMDQETTARFYQESLHLQWLSTTLSHGLSQLEALWEVSIDSTKYSALLVLQGAFHRSLNGRLGWRVANRELGSEISDARNKAKIVEGTRAFQTFKQALEAEDAWVRSDQAQQFDRERAHICAVESGDRTALAAEQELERKVIYRAHNQGVEEVHVPYLCRCMDEEDQERLEMDVQEEWDRELLTTTRAELCAIILHKGAAQQEESLTRKSVVKAERAAWREIVGHELDRREEIRIDRERRELECANARAAFCDSAEAEVREHHKHALAAYVARMAEALLEVLQHAACDDPGRRRVEQAEAAAARELLEGLSVNVCNTFADELAAKRYGEMATVHQRAMYIEEIERRASILHEERLTWIALEPQLLALFSGPLRDFIERRAAIEKISGWYRAVQSGEVGREVTRQRLRDAVARHHQERHLRCQQVSQRLHMQQVRQQLDMLMQEMRKERGEAIRQLLHIVVEREEPRGRQQVEALQGTVFHIIERNAEMYETELRRQAVNSEALLWQQESYERALALKMWRREHESLVRWQRRELSDDYFATQIQRVWRRYSGRVRCEQGAVVQSSRLAALESQARAAVELEEVEEAATQVFMPCFSEAYTQKYAHRCLARVCDDWALAVVHDIGGEEWRARVNLLWEMRYEACDSVLCEEERRGRCILRAGFHQPFLNQIEEEAEERLQRSLLMRERCLFLHRVLAREEQERRAQLESAQSVQWASLTRQSP